MDLPRVALAAALGSMALRTVEAADWPQWLGPDRNGATSESVSVAWGVDGPKVVWMRAVGKGFSGPVVSGGRLVLHQRRDEEEVVECLDAMKGGDPIWTARWSSTYRDDFGFEDGPRATPALADGRVYVLGAEGLVTCLDLGSGKKVWAVSMVKEYGADKGYFGFACSPLVAEGKVFLNVGGANGAGVVALDAATGGLRWKATGHEAGYAAPVVFDGGEAGRVAFFTREGLVVARVSTGVVEAEYPWRSRQNASVNAATPLVVGNRVFLTSSYGTGAVLLEVTGSKLRKVWSGDDSLSSHYASVVERDEFVFGFHGRQESGAALRCVELATGKVRWEAPAMGSGTVIRARDRLVVLTERGELLVAAAVSERFGVLARAQVLGMGVRATPALAGGRLYARDTKKLVCLEVGEGVR